ncbi:MAG TPA: polysaccharide biosynthesis protein [Marmoricola sp.]|nr:polysaccharide biosynthesis protein [Marmoricola sp.]
MTSPAPADANRSLSGGGAIAVAMGVMNVATYAYTMVAARWLGPQSYGAFAALMGLLLVVGVLQLGLQATAARRIAASPGDVRQIERSVLKVTYGAALVLGLLCLAFSPLIDSVLRLHSIPTAVLVAVSAVPMTVMGGQAGVLQGERRWRELALVYLANGLPRLVVGTALVLWQPTEFVAMLGVTIGQVAPVVVGWWALRHGRPAADGEPATGDHGGRAVLVETAHNSHALLAFFALSNVDVLVARSVLPAHEAGLYAAGVIVVKAVLFLPQFVVVVAFPSMSTESDRRRVLLGSIGLVALIGTVCTAGAKALSALALVFVGGHQYVQVESDLWLFAVLGTLLSMLQLLVYSVLARQSRYAVYAIWVALLAVVGFGRLAGGYEDLLGLVVLVDGCLFGVLLAASLWRLRRPAEPVAEG